jgi:hypothetical protein
MDMAMEKQHHQGRKNPEQVKARGTLRYFFLVNNHL